MKKIEINLTEEQVEQFRALFMVIGEQLGITFIDAEPTPLEPPKDPFEGIILRNNTKIALGKLKERFGNGWFDPYDIEVSSLYFESGVKHPGSFITASCISKGLMEAEYHPMKDGQKKKRVKMVRILF